MRRVRRGARPRRTRRGTVRTGNEAGADAAALECRDLREWISGGRRARVPGILHSQPSTRPRRTPGGEEELFGTSLFLGPSLFVVPRQVLEPRVAGEEREIDYAHRAVPLLPDDDLGLPLFLLGSVRLGVHLLPVDEQNQI